MLKKAEWFETLQEFDAEIIKETIAHVKKNHDQKKDEREEFPNIFKFHSIALGKAKQRKARREMEERERQKATGKVLEYNNSDAAEKARAEIRRVCGLRSVSNTGRDNIVTDENHSKH